MLSIEKIDHVGIRISNKAASLAFYEALGFDLVNDAGFEDGHPIIVRHAASGVTLNLLGPSTSSAGHNVLMDIDEKHPGYTHIALRIASLGETRRLLQENSIPITGSFRFGGLSAVFIRDPDRNVIELDEFRGDEAERRVPGESDSYANHP